MKKSVLIAMMVFPLVVSCAHKKKGMDEKSVAKMFTKLDKDKDGMITQAEFDSKHSGMFAKMDSNNDGNISMAEAKGHHSKMKKSDDGDCNCN